MADPTTRPLMAVPPPPVVEEPVWHRVLAVAGGVLLVALVGYAAVAVLRPEPSPQDEMWAAALAKAQQAPAQPGPLERTGALQVTTDSADAQVWIDEEWAGTLPLHLDGVAAGVHGIRVGTDREVLLDSLVYVRRGDTTSLFIAAPAAPPTPAKRGRTRQRRRSSGQRIADALEDLAPAPIRAPVPLAPQASPPGGGGR